MGAQLSLMPTNSRREARAPRFMLGAHHPSWLRTARVPLFVSRRTLSKLKKLPRAAAPWGQDSGGFIELQLHGEWTVSAAQYVTETRRNVAEIGQMLFAAPRDWMCEPQVIGGLVERRKAKACPSCKGAGRRALGKVPTMRTVSLDADERPLFCCPVCAHEERGKAPQIKVGTWLQWARGRGRALAQAVAYAERLGVDAVVVFHGTGLSVEEHQRRTIEDFLELRRLAPEIPWIPVLQGWHVTDYWRHIEMYLKAGVDLRDEPLVGVGSVCRRQGTTVAELIFRTLAEYGLRLHGFGVKATGLARFAQYLISADSMAWSDHARRRPPMIAGHDKPGPGRRKGHKNCANCLEWALQSYWMLVEKLGFEERRAA